MDSVFSGRSTDVNIDLPQVQFEDKVRYFPWNDDFNYGKLCRRVLSRISKNNTHYIIAGSIAGGIGHKYLSLLYSVTYAILLKRRFFSTSSFPSQFIVHMRDAFWSETSSCLRSLRYEGGYQGLVICSRASPCVSSYTTSLVDEMPKANLLMLDFRLPSLFSEENLERLRGIGLLGPGEGWDVYKKRIIRLLLNPSRANIRLIRKEWEKLQVPRVDLSTHIRCGGQLADHPEATVMVSPETLERVPALIRQVLRNFTTAISADGRVQGTPVVYLSTDSSKAEAKLRSELAEMRLLTVSSLQRGHTVFAGATSLERALLDIYLICKSDTFLATQGSGFSQIARMLCMPSHYAFIPVNKTHSASGVCNKHVLLGSSRVSGPLSRGEETKRGELRGSALGSGIDRFFFFFFFFHSVIILIIVIAIEIIAIAIIVIIVLHVAPSREIRTKEGTATRRGTACCRSRTPFSQPAANSPLWGWENPPFPAPLGRSDRSAPS